MTEDNKLNIFKRVLLGENYKQLAAEYRCSDSTIRGIFQEIIGKIDISPNKKKLIREFPLSDKKNARAYDRHGEYVGLSHINILYLRKKADVLIGLATAPNVDFEIYNEKIHALEFLAFEIINFLSNNYQAIANRSEGLNVKIDLVNPDYILSRLTKMGFIVTGSEHKFKFEMRYERSKIYYPYFALAEAVYSFDGIKDPDYTGLYEKLLEVTENIRKFRYVAK